MAGAGTAYPADAVTGSPTYTATQGRTAMAGAMGGATSARPLGGFSGVRPGTSSTIATATSTTWTVTAFGGYTDLESSATNGGYFFSFQSTSTGTVTAAAGSARVDLLYVQIADSNTGDGTSGAPRVILDYQAGTAGAGIPTLSAARAFVIAQINVPASGGGSPTVTWVAPYAVAAGGIVPAASSATYPAAASYPNQYLDDMALGGLLRSNGTSWVALSGGLVPITPTSVTGGTVSGSGAVTFTTASSIAMNGVFSSAYDNYLLILDVPTHSTGSVTQFRLRVAGVDDSTASSYQNQVQTNTVSTPSTAQSVGTVGLHAGSGASTEDAIKTTFFAPALARVTRWQSEYFSVVSSIVAGSTYGRHTQAVAYDGLDIIPSTGTITGTVHVYGYVK